MTMRLGVVFPQEQIGADGGAAAAYAQGVEALGFDHLISIDHVLGANTASRPDWDGPYTIHDFFHEPLTLFAFMAGATAKLRFKTGVLILPQRQTALVAKQAASLDQLSNGRLMLGVGTGWNEVEYDALGVDFAARGKIFDEQIEALRRLWTQPAVIYEGAHHRIDDAGINPLPLQRPIPLWFGGGGRNPATGTVNLGVVIRRIARLGDGWMMPYGPDEEGAEVLAKFRAYCGEIGRDPAEIGLEGYLPASRADDSWRDRAVAWRRLGATDLALNLNRDGLSGVDAHLRQLEAISGELRSMGVV